MGKAKPRQQQQHNQPPPETPRISMFSLKTTQSELTSPPTLPMDKKTLFFGKTQQFLLEAVRKNHSVWFSPAGCCSASIISPPVLWLRCDSNTSLAATSWGNLERKQSQTSNIPTAFPRPRKNARGALAGNALKHLVLQIKVSPVGVALTSHYEANKAALICEIASDVSRCNEPGSSFSFKSRALKGPRRFSECFTSQKELGVSLFSLRLGAGRRFE